MVCSTDYRQQTADCEVQAAIYGIRSPYSTVKSVSHSVQGITEKLPSVECIGRIHCIGTKNNIFNKLNIYNCHPMMPHTFETKFAIKICYVQITILTKILNEVGM